MEINGCKSRANIEQWSRYLRSAVNVKYERVSLLCVLYRLVMVLEELTTILLLYLVFMCFAGYGRREGRLEMHWEGDTAVFMGIC